MSYREDILRRASELVTTTREEKYAAPDQNLSLAGDLILLVHEKSFSRTTPLSPGEIACLTQICVKLARIVTGSFHLDNYIDLAGYAALAGELAAKSPRPSTSNEEPFELKLPLEITV